MGTLGFFRVASTLQLLSESLENKGFIRSWIFKTTPKIPQDHTYQRDNKINDDYTSKTGSVKLEIMAVCEGWVICP
jgi:hypothetical protein